MTPRTFQYSPAAEADITNILNHLADLSIPAASKVADALDDTVRTIAQQPFIGEKLTSVQLGDVRRSLVAAISSYAIYYQVTDDCVLILRVLHTARDVEKAWDE